MNPDWREIPGNENAFNRLRELVISREAIAFVGAGASAGLYPLWDELIRDLVDKAVQSGTTTASRDYWLSQFRQAPDFVADRIKHTMDPGVFAQSLREIFRPKAGLDGNYFTPLQGALLQIPFKGYITTNFDPGLLEARLRLRPDSRPTGFGTWQDSDVVFRWQTGEIFREQPCPILFAHGIYERSDTIILGAAEYKKAYHEGPYRRLFQSIWYQRRLVFVGFGFSDLWINAAAREGLFAGAYTPAPQHFALLGLRSIDEYTEEMRLKVSNQYGAEAVFYPIVPMSADRVDHGALRAILEQMASVPSSDPGGLAATPAGDPDRGAARKKVAQRWVHETTEDEYFTGRIEELQRLDRWSADPDVRIIAVTGMGGLGKTSLVARWLKGGADRLRRTIKGIIFWSIYSNRDVKQLFAEIVRFGVVQLGVPRPASKQDDAAVALRVLRSTSMLLVIDGLELLQDIPSFTGNGALLKADLRDLLDGFCRAKHGSSMVILTSRFPFADLSSYLGRGLRALDLGHLTDAEGASLLKACDVGGIQAEREAATRRLNGHPLGLRLFALTLAHQGDGDPSRLIEQVFDTAGLSDEVPLERKLKHLLLFYGEAMPRMQAALLGIVSFFRSVVDEESILALARGLPTVVDAEQGSADGELQKAMQSLRSSTDDELRGALRALGREHLLIGDTANSSWSCHPILRDHFRQRLLGWAPGFAQKTAGFLENQFQQSLRGRQPESIGLATARPSLDRPKNTQDLEPIIVAVELLLDANDFDAADQLFRERLDDGNAFRQLAVPSDGMRCALGFVRNDDRRHVCERKLGKLRVASYAKLVGVFARQAGEFEFGSRYLEEATEIYRESNEKKEQSIALQNWTGLLVILGRLSDAERRAREAVDVAEAADLDAEKKGSRSYLGTVLGKQGKISEALAEFAKATYLEKWINRDVEGLFGHRGIRHADLLLRLARIDEVQRLTEANLKVCKENAWWEEIAQCWSILGEVASRRGEDAQLSGEIEQSESFFRDADQQLSAAEDVFRSGHTVSQIPRILLARGELARRRHNWDGATAMFEEVMTLAPPRQMRLDHADALLLSARLRLDQINGDGQTSSGLDEAAYRASDDADAALQIAREWGYAWAVRDALLLLARSHQLLGSTDRAARFRGEAAALSARLASPH